MTTEQADQLQAIYDTITASDDRRKIITIIGETYTGEWNVRISTITHDVKSVLQGMGYDYTQLTSDNFLLHITGLLGGQHNLASYHLRDLYPTLAYDASTGVITLSNCGLDTGQTVLKIRKYKILALL